MLLKLLGKKDAAVAMGQKKQHKKPLINLEIDRIALDKAGVDQLAIDRIYRGLYAGSVGVYDILTSALINVNRSDRF